MNIAVIEDLERRYQLLVGDYQTGKIDETTFVSRVDSLQFQDEAGRYWMLGAQNGAWHYYDGQTWHQADPRDADNLPFVDDQGRYWQRGAASGEWYYYDTASSEWVKPDPRDRAIPQATQSNRSEANPYQSHLRPQSADAGPAMPSPSEGELFQDDEGRYWMVGAKTGQWYFYEIDGWHPAHEFQARPAPAQPYQPQFTPPAYAYPYQPPPQPQPVYMPPYQSPQPAPTYNFPPQPVAPQPAPPPSQDYAPPPPAPQPAQAPVAPVVEAPRATPVEPVAPMPDMPNPPSAKSDSGAWYYFDGKQWLKYSSGEPADVPPPDPAKIVEQKAEPAKPKAESKPAEAAVVAELFEDDDDEIEVVDVEVITVFEAEPDEKPAPRPAPAPAAPPTVEDVRPRRASRPVEPITTGPMPFETQRQPRERTSTEPGRPVMPRKPEMAHEPTIIIPTESAASSIGGSTRITRPVMPVQPRRAREDTIPMETVAAPRQDMTQPLPQQVPTPRSNTDQIKVVRARENTKEVAPAPKAAVPASAKTGHTLGDVLRAFPSTVWTLAIGLAVLLIFAVIIIVAGSWLSGSEYLASLGLGAAQSPTPTVGVVVNFTPTPAPTPEATPAPIVTMAPPVTTTYSSPNLGFTLEYPQDWQLKENAQQVVFSPSINGLDPTLRKDAALWVGMPEDKAAPITDILTQILSQFPADTTTLNQGTISIASQTWTSAQIKFSDENLGGPGIANLAVTSKDGKGYYLVAVAPEAQWNVVKPLFQGMINSFRFTKPVEVATTLASTQTTTINLTSTLTISTPTTPAVKAAPAAQATPLTYVVQSGDTLLAIAVKFNIDPALLAAKNNIENANSLRAGQELVIPFTDEELATYTAGGGAPATSAAAITSTATAPSGGEAAAPAPAPTAAAQTAAAPVGGRIVYPAFNPGSNNYDVWLVDVGSGKQSVIASNASQPAFNKDGSLLAYRSWAMDSRGIFFRDFIGGRGGQVTRFVEDGMPTWAPDSFSFAFATRREGDRVPRIYRGDQLAQNEIGLGFQGEYPSELPDGRIVVKGCLPSGECGLFIIGPSGGSETKISGEGTDTAPAASPDGSKIAFMSSGRGATNWEIWVMNTDGSNPQRLTQNGSNDGLPAWSPDSKSIAFVSDQGGAWAIWAMNADGSNQRKLIAMNGSPDGKILYAGTDSRGWLEERISWAP